MINKSNHHKNRVLILFIFILSSALSSVGCFKKSAGDPKDNSLYFPLITDVKGLDPMKISELYSAFVVAQIYEGLLQYHYLKMPLQPEPLLAESMPEISADGLTYTFKIRKGSRFQDDPCFTDGKGREITAKDFVYSWKRLADPRNQSDAFWLFDGHIKGLNEWAQLVKSGQATYETPIEGLSTPDDYTLVIRLTKPYYQLNNILTMPQASVVPHEAVDKYGKELVNHPVGSGPYQLDKWIHGSQVILIKNKNWHGGKYPSEGEAGDQEKGLLADAGKDLPFIDRVVFMEMPEAAPRWQNFMKGRLDYVSIPADNFDSAIEFKNNVANLRPEYKAKNIELEVSDELDLTYIGFNMSDPLLGKNKQLRLAIALADDPHEVIKKFYNNLAERAEDILPPGLEGDDPHYKSPLQSPNFEAAKEALRKAGYPEGKGLPELVYEAPSDSVSRQMAELFSQKMAQIGIRIRIQTFNWPRHVDALEKGQFQIAGLAWIADYPDPQNFYQLLYGKNIPPGENKTRFVNTEFDKIYETFMKQPPGPERIKSIQQMRDIIAQEVPVFFHAHRKRRALRHSWMSPVKFSNTNLNFFKYMRINPQKRSVDIEKL